MKKLNQFKEKLGTAGNDRIRVRDRQIGYGRAGDDKLTAIRDPLLGVQSTSLLVGGGGADTYVASSQGVTVILDAGEAKDPSTLVARGIGLNRATSFVLDIGNRHLLFGDTDSQQVVIALDWKKARNRISTLELSDGRYSIAGITNQYRSLPGYLGSYSWQALETSLLDLDRIGLSPATINRTIDAVLSRARQL